MHPTCHTGWIKTAECKYYSINLMIWLKSPADVFNRWSKKKGLILYTGLTQLRVKATSSTHTHTHLCLLLPRHHLCQEARFQQTSVRLWSRWSTVSRRRKDANIMWICAGWLTLQLQELIKHLTWTGSSTPVPAVGRHLGCRRCNMCPTGWKERVWSRFNLDCAWIVSTQQQDSL